MLQFVGLSVLMVWPWSVRRIARSTQYSFDGFVGEKSQEALLMTTRGRLDGEAVCAWEDGKQDST